MLHIKRKKVINGVKSRINILCVIYILGWFSCIQSWFWYLMWSFEHSLVVFLPLSRWGRAVRHGYLKHVAWECFIQWSTRTLSWGLPPARLNSSPCLELPSCFPGKAVYSLWNVCHKDGASASLWVRIHKRSPRWWWALERQRRRSPWFCFQFHAFVNHFNTVKDAEMQSKGEINLTWSLLLRRWTQ